MKRDQTVYRLAGSGIRQQHLSKTPTITTERFRWAALTLPGTLLLMPSTNPSRQVSHVLGKVNVAKETTSAHWLVREGLVVGVLFYSVSPLSCKRETTYVFLPVLVISPPLGKPYFLTGSLRYSA